MVILPPLSGYVGLNLDIAHLLSAGVSANEIENLKDAIVHAHISDLPGIHSRDQVPATFTFPKYEQYESPDQGAAYAPYISLLRRCPGTQTEIRPGFSGVCALELEGCGADRVGSQRRQRDEAAVRPDVTHGLTVRLAVRVIQLLNRPALRLPTAR